jgi:uncharacterized membrane protein YdcZ (DUF606 family)
MPTVPAKGIDGRSLAAAGMCILALFIDGFGWLLAIAGIYMLRRSSFNTGTRWVLGTVALGPKLLFLGIKAMNAPPGLSFTIQPSNLATSSALWAWTGLMIGIGVILLLQSRRQEHPANEPFQSQPKYEWLVPLIGVAMVAGGVALLLGLQDGFERIDDAGHGRWVLHHAVKGRVAEFSGGDVSEILVEERHHSRGSNDYAVKFGLKDGHSYSVTLKTAFIIDELRKFATTANLAPGKLRLVPYRGATWTSGNSKITLKDCIGVYEMSDANAHRRSTVEFWIENERLMGKETVNDTGQPQVRVLRNIKLDETGEMEYQPASYLEASHQKEENVTRISLSWAPQAESGKFIPGGFETGGQQYRKR